MPHRVFNLQEVARYLHIDSGEVEELVQEREIPFEQKGGRVVFSRRDIDSWASRRILALPEQGLQGYHRQSSARVQDFSKQRAIIPELIRPAGVEPALRSRTKASLLRDLVAVAERTGLVNDAKELLASLVERERLYRFADSLVVVGRAIQAVPFGSPDGTTTDLFFLIGCQNDRLHLHVLARICMMCHHTNLLLSLREAADADEMLRCLNEAEQDVLRTM
ncbi:MAG: PTS sugar transporter subunit IIA [Kiritimatiellaeota bacterium]|nr:PTS sugar transporter subunit IIA [Kiritimatiellota bacterium]